jgi:hypothetical protein
MSDVHDVPLYHHPIKHPVKPNDLFYIAKQINKEWHIRRGAPTIKIAAQSRGVFMRVDHRLNPKTKPTDYRIIKKGLNEIIILKE